jgi:hypothetical protein
LRILKTLKNWSFKASFSFFEANIKSFIKNSLFLSEIMFNSYEKEKLTDLIKPILDDISEKVELTNWDAQKVKEKFGRRSINEILEDGEIFYFNPCSELSLLLNQGLFDRGISPVLVVAMQKYNNRDVLHFASEFKYDSLYTVHFKERQIVEVIKGPYVNTRKDIIHLNEIRYSEKINPDVPLIENGFSSLGLDKFLDLDKQVEKMIRDNENPCSSTKKYIDSLKDSSGFNLQFFEGK